MFGENKETKNSGEIFLTEICRLTSHYHAKLFFDNSLDCLINPRMTKVRIFIIKSSVGFVSF